MQKKNKRTFGSRVGLGNNMETSMLLGMAYCAREARSGESSVIITWVGASKTWGTK